MDENAPKLGRPTKFNDSLREKMLELAEKGKTIEEIAEIIGVTSRTIYNWQGKYQSLFHALKESKQVADELVEASLFARAVGYSHPEQKVFCHEGEIITHELEKHYPPETGAASLWLRNRQPDLWREKQPGEADVIINNITAKSDKDLDKAVDSLLSKLNPISEPLGE